MDNQHISALKAECRVRATAQRAAAFAADPDAGAALTQQFLRAIALAPGEVVSGYWPLAGELDVRPLLVRLRDRGHPIGLPVVIRSGEPLLFRQWRADDELTVGSFRVMTPPADAPEVTPRVLLVPMLAFDPMGFRLGYGGGFYDRTLDRLRAQAAAAGGTPPLAVGIAYRAQEMPDVPRGPYDQPLDWLVTENSAVNFAEKSEY